MGVNFLSVDDLVRQMFDPDLATGMLEGGSKGRGEFIREQRSLAVLALPHGAYA